MVAAAGTTLVTKMNTVPATAPAKDPRNAIEASLASTTTITNRSTNTLPRGITTPGLERIVTMKATKFLAVMTSLRCRVRGVRRVGMKVEVEAVSIDMGIGIIMERNLEGRMDMEVGSGIIRMETEGL